MVKLNERIKGSTMVEVLTAMVIIFTCLGIAMSIFNNLSRDINDELLIQAQICMNSYATETLLKKDFTEATQEFENFHIQRTILPYPKKARLKVLFLEAITPAGKKIGEYREIVVIDITGLYGKE